MNTFKLSKKNENHTKGGTNMLDMLSSHTVTNILM